MRVLFLYKYLTLGGCEAVLRARLDELRDHGIQARVWFFHDLGGRSVFRGVEDRIQVGNLGALVAHLARAEYEIVSTLDTEEILPYFRSTHRLPQLVIESHSPYVENLEYLRHTADLPVRAFFVPSRYQATIVQQRTDSVAPITVIPNPLCTGFEEPLRPFLPTSTRPVVAWFGRLDSLKNWREFVQIAGALVHQGRRAEFWLAGRPQGEQTAWELYTLARDEGVLPHLRWFRGISHDRVPRFMDAVRCSGGVVISTSRGESFGMVAAEAMARGCVVMAPAWGPFPEFITPGETGLLYEPADVQGGAEAIDSVMRENDRRERLGTAARASILARHGARVAIDVLVAELQRIAGSISPLGVSPSVERTTPPRRFEAAVREYYDITARDRPRGVVATWLAYALSTNQRGEELAAGLSRLLDRFDWSNARVLDVGCAYGGVLRAFARRGAEVLGIDANERLLALAAANLADAPESGHRLEHVRLEDLDASRVGPFDLIVCDNVLEHVADPSAAVECLSPLLAVGGGLYIAVPNPFAPEQVRSDPHFAIAGITLLERDLAERYFRALGMQGEYTVGRYATSEQYFAWLAAAALDARYATRTTFFGEQFRSEIGDVERIAAAITGTSTDLTRRLSALTLPEDLQRALGDAIREYEEGFRRDVIRAPDQSGRALLMEWYGPQVWHFFAVRGGSRGPGSRPRTIRS